MSVKFDLTRKKRSCREGSALGHLRFAPKRDAAITQAEAQLRRYASDQNLVPMLTRGLQLKTGTLLFVGGKDVEWRELVLSA